jgi:hypothetical protein
LGKDADHLATRTDFPVETLEGVGRPDLPAVLKRETVKGEDVDLGLLRHGDPLK